MKSAVLAAKPPIPPRPRKSVQPRMVRFEIIAPSAHSVSLVGTFNQWKPESARMTALEGGRWVKEVPLLPGTYEYRYVVDGNWIQDPKAEHSVTNPFGERNSLLSVKGRSASGNGHGNGNGS